MVSAFRIAPATSADLADIAALFRAYAAGLPIDLGYQDFEAELASLPGKYAPPAGALFIARGPDGTALGCVALRPLADPGVCEMKRLYVAPAARGTGLGRALAETITAESDRLAYSEMRLDTLPVMAPAIGIYERLGFVRTGAYYDTPVEGTLFFVRPLPARP